MCGIIGIIGKAPWRTLLVDGLKRLEYRGYDSAGVATLVNGRIERRRAEGKLDNLAACWTRSRSPAPSASATPAGRPTAGPARPTPIRTRPTASPWSTTASSRTSRSCANELEAGARLRDRDRHRGGRPSGDRGLDRQMTRSLAVRAACRLEGAFALAMSSPGATT